MHQAETELSEAEPALLSAQSSVRSIKKPQLDEIRTLTRCEERLNLQVGRQNPHISGVVAQPGECRRRLLHGQPLHSAALNVESPPPTHFGKGPSGDFMSGRWGVGTYRV